jgi:hypothetical protein
MILSKNELRSSSGRIRNRVRVRAGIDYGVTAVSIMSCSCPTTVPLQCPTYVIVVPFVFLLSVASACSTIRVPLSHYSAVRLFAVRCSRSCSLSAVLGPVRVFVVRCYHVVLVHASSLCVVPTLFLCADTSRLLYAALQVLFIRLHYIIVKHHQCNK